MVFRSLGGRRRAKDLAAMTDLGSWLQKVLDENPGNIVIATVNPIPNVDYDGQSLGLILVGGAHKLLPASSTQQRDTNGTSQLVQPDCSYDSSSALIVVEQILSGSPFEGTPLQPGMVLLRINDMDMKGKTIGQVESYLSHHAHERIRVWAHHDEAVGSEVMEEVPDCTSLRRTTHTHSLPKQQKPFSPPPASTIDVQKPSSQRSMGIDCWGRSIVVVANKKGHGVNPNLGLSLLQDEETGQIIVDRIDASSPLHHHETSLLREGMIITSVNGLMIHGMGVDVVRSMIHDAPNCVVLTADIPLAIEVPSMIRQRIAATIHKTSVDEPVGLSFWRIPNASLGHPRHNHQHHHYPPTKKSFTTLVGRITPQSPFRETTLQVGMTVVSVNGVDVTSTDVRSLLRYLQECSGRVVILAEMDVPAREVAMLNASERTGSSTEFCTELSNPNPDRSPHRSTISSHSPPSQTLWNSPELPARQMPSTTLTFSGSSSSRPRPLTIQVVGTTSSSSYSSNSNSRLDDSYLNRAFTVEAMKGSTKDRIGLALNEDSGSFFIAQIAVDSVFRNTPLHVGCELLNINGIQLFGMDMAFVSMILQSVAGRIQLGALPAAG